MKPPDRKRIEPDGVFVKKSTLPGAGKGLFTRRAISKGERIIEYKGRITTFKQVQESGTVNPYVYYVNRNYVIDAMPFPDSLGRYVNDAEGPVTLPGCSNNAKFIVVNKKVFFEAVTDILPGAEIFVSYGKSYWETIAFNKAVEKTYGTKRK
jgi:SET domain-containing protein